MALSGPVRRVPAPRAALRLPWAVEWDPVGVSEIDNRLGDPPSTSDQCASLPLTPKGSHNKAQGKRSAALGQAANQDPGPERATHIQAWSAGRQNVWPFQGRFGGPSPPGLRYACPGLWSGTPLGSRRSTIDWAIRPRPRISALASS